MTESLFEIPDLLQYDATTYKTKPESKKSFQVSEVRFVIEGNRSIESHQKTLNRIRTISEAVNFSRYLVDEPGNSITPDTLAENAKKLSKDGIKVSLLNKPNLSKMGGIQAVSKGSVNPPQLIILELNPGKSRPVLLVGKAVTFAEAPR
ncbi:hypothetical protein HYY75_08060 [bacterium]|nr:hypothetical protein [bacterium]